MSAEHKIDAAVFDLGGVLFDWNPRNLYRKLFSSEKDMEVFLAEVCTANWNHEMDAGKLPSVAVAELSSLWPTFRANIQAYRDRWKEMLGNEFAENVALFRQLRARMPCYALTNFASENFVIARERFGFLGEFNDILVSATVGSAKPDPWIFNLAMKRFNVCPSRTIFIDDRIENVEAACAMGFIGIQFLNPAQLRSDVANIIG